MDALFRCAFAGVKQVVLCMRHFNLNSISSIFKYVSFLKKLDLVSFFFHPLLFSVPRYYIFRLLIQVKKQPAVASEFSRNKKWKSRFFPEGDFSQCNPITLTFNCKKFRHLFGFSGWESRSLSEIVFWMVFIEKAFPFNVINDYPLS